LAVANQYEGFFVPTVVDGRLEADWRALFLALAGLFVDRQYGLLVFTPVYALAIVGLVALWRSPSYRWAAVSLGIIGVPYTLLTADFRVWWGGWSPPARYLAILAPLLAMPLARSLLALGRAGPYLVLFALLAAVGVLASATFLIQLGDPEIEQAIFSNPSRNPMMLRWLMLRFGVNLSPLLPGVAPWFSDQRSPVPWPQIAGSIALLSLMAGLTVRALPRDGQQQSRAEHRSNDPLPTKATGRSP
jgi:hypothetical protein